MLDEAANDQQHGAHDEAAETARGVGADSQTWLLEARQISRRFAGVRALHGVSLALRHGEVLAVIGENGAGKSTLMKILAGIQSADSGQILIEGQPVRLGSVREATAVGITLIHQELNLAENLDVAANLFLGREPQRWGIVNRRRLRDEARRWLARVGLDIEPQTPIHSLSIGHRQMVEIAKALSVNARVLIMDEPTSSLSMHETRQLYRVVHDLKASGVSVIYISHRLGEVRELADRVVVLRDGENAGQLLRPDITHDRMVSMMVGRELSQFYARQPNAPGDEVLQVRDVVTRPWPQHALNLTVRAGEIVGLAGLVGAGRTELLQTLFGILTPLRGQVLVAGRVVRRGHAAHAIGCGMALVPEDRKQHGLITSMTVRNNIGLTGLRRNQGPLGMLNRRAERATADAMVAQLGIRTAGIDQLVQNLSGGNQQKVVLSKWLSLEPRVLLLDEPTRGVDIGAKHEIYRLMDQLAQRGVAILFASSELDEVLGMADRALVMHQGRVMGELLRHELSEQAIMHLATGGEAAPVSEVGD